MKSLDNLIKQGEYLLSKVETEKILGYGIESDVLNDSDFELLQDWRLKTKLVVCKTPLSDEFSDYYELCGTNNLVSTAKIKGITNLLKAIKEDDYEG